MAMFNVSVSRGASANSEVAFVSGSRVAFVRSSGLNSSARTVSLSRTSFLGCTQVLQCVPLPLQERWNPKRLLGVRAVVKRRKDPSFDNVVQREKKVRIVNKIKAILVKEPGRVMSLLKLGKYRRDIGLKGKSRVVSLLNKYPAVFEVFEDGCNMMFVRFTLEAEEQYEEEQKLTAELESIHVEKLRKMLMMSVDKRLALDKIAHLRHDLGLPDDFKVNMCTRYPEYFKIVDTEIGPALELTFWDPLLAVSFAEKKAAAEASRADDKPKIIIDGEEIVSTALSSKSLNLPKGLNLTKKDKQTALKFQKMPYISPYSDSTGLNPASPEAEKRVAGTVHELLSLTLEKRTLVDHLTHFRKDYKFSQRIHSMLIRHPELFYVSFKGHRDSVFLREAWERSELLEKDPVILAKERLRQLVRIRHASTRESSRVNSDGEEIDGYYEEEDSDEEFDDGQSDDEYDDDEGESDYDESDGKDNKDSKVNRVLKEPLPVRSYAPSPRKPVKRLTDFPPRPESSISGKSPFVQKMENVPRERW